jgi:hypothetical protein
MLFKQLIWSVVIVGLLGDSLALVGVLLVEVGKGGLGFGRAFLKITEDTSGHPFVAVIRREVNELRESGCMLDVFGKIVHDDVPR